VSVRGIVRFVDGKPSSVEVESFDAMPTNEELEDEDEIRGIDITSGEDSVTYVRKLRDAE